MLQLYNTRSKKIEDFVPIKPPDIGLYTCGPTVYSTAHIGNLRTYIFEDILRRALEFNGFSVKHIMNITDVGHLTSDADEGEDKVEQAARREHRQALDIAREHEHEFFRDLKRLNIMLPTKVLRATESIDLQIALVRQLENKGFTYRTNDGIYFDTEKFPAYGRLSRQSPSDKKAGARVALNPEKRHPSDFALWKFSPPKMKRQLEWDSPWGVGFPGWHIECSAMSMKELGEQFDIHAGGIDHIPVHHENEIAQSEAATGKHPFVRFWVHGEHLVLPSKRMGKSERNEVLLADVIKQSLDPLAFRYLCLQTHYRSPLTFSWDALQAAHDGLQRLWSIIDSHPDAPRIGCAEFEQHFKDAVNHDLDTPQALAITHRMLKSHYPWHAKRRSLAVFDRVLGLNLLDASTRPSLPPLDSATQENVDQLIAVREQSRQAKNWTRADELRRQINDLLLPYDRVLDDTDDGPLIRRR